MATANAVKVDSADRRALRLMGTILLVALVMQRLGPVIGSSYLSIVGPIGLALGAYGAMRNIFVVHRTRAIVFAGFVGWILAGAAVHAALPESYGATASWMSLVQFVIVTGFGLLVVSRRLDVAHFFGMINRILLYIAVAGLLQFVLQFVGVSLFSFKLFVPDNFLLEGPYNTVIAIGNSGYFKANGFFLVEPSVFSQFMAPAIIIEMLMGRRLVFLGIYASALMASVSGTGWLMIGSFILTSAFSLGIRGLIISISTLFVALLGFGALALLLPDIFDVFISRTDEVFNIGSSGHLRFVTPWWLFDYVLSSNPWAALYGIGAGVTEHLGMPPPWDYNINPPVKISLEYGIPCFALYVFFLLIGQKTKAQQTLIVPIFVFLLFDGGYQQFPPVVFPSMLLIMTANLRPIREQSPN